MLKLLLPQLPYQNIAFREGLLLQNIILRSDSPLRHGMESFIRSEEEVGTEASIRNGSLASNESCHRCRQRRSFKSHHQCSICSRASWILCFLSKSPTIPTFTMTFPLIVLIRPTRLPEMTVDFGYRSHGATAVLAKSMINAYYKEDPSYSYYVGCSNGGREALVVAQKYPTLFNGIVAGAPVISFVGTNMRGIWNNQYGTDQEDRQRP